MKSQDCFEISKWASKIAHEQNKSITYVLMKVHEAMNQHTCIEAIKEYALKQIMEVDV